MPARVAYGLFSADSVGSLGSLGKNPRAIDVVISASAREVTPSASIVANEAVGGCLTIDD